MKPIAVVGAGNGGCAMSAHLTLQGFEVNLCEIYFPKRIEDLENHGGIELTGAAGNALVRPKLMTTNIGDAIQDVEFIIWPIPASGHEFHVREIAPHLKPGQHLILTPGAVGGALFVANLLHQLKVRNIHIGETCTLPYGCRLTSPFRVEVYDVAKYLLFAMLPDVETERVFKLLNPVFPNLTRGETVLETSLSYPNLLLHPAGIILNTGWIEHRKGDFAYYYDGISPSVAKILEELDIERLNIVRAFNLKPMPFVEWFFRRGKTENKDSMYSAIHTSIPNRTIRAPESLDHRFILEDVPFALVPLHHFGQLLNMPTPVTDALILLASRMCGRDFLKEGSDLEKMGISKMSPREVKKWVTEGNL
ncbi:MAG: NAD/NADP octopine/nopaline dehydrogenase family protein [Candidatus Hodarchaeota archaeon]